MKKISISKIFKVPLKVASHHSAFILRTNSCADTFGVVFQMSTAYCGCFESTVSVFHLPCVFTPLRFCFMSSKSKLSLFAVN